MLRLRWQIERLFRLWKQEGLIDEWNSKKPWRVLCELYAKLAAMVIQHWLIVAGTWQDPHRSLVKAAQVVQREAGSLMAAIRDQRLPIVIERTLECMQSGCRIQKRKEQPSTAQLLEGAPLPAKRCPPKAQYRHAALLHRWPAGKGWAYQGYQHSRGHQPLLTSCLWIGRVMPPPPTNNFPSNTINTCSIAAILPLIYIHCCSFHITIFLS